MDDDVKDALDALTAQVTDLKSQVDTLTQTLTESGQKNDDLSKKVDDMQETSDRMKVYLSGTLVAALAAGNPAGPIALVPFS